MVTKLELFSTLGALVLLELAFFITAPAQTHATSAAVYLALLNFERFLHYSSCPTVRDWVAVYPALFWYKVSGQNMQSV